MGVATTWVATTGLELRAGGERRGGGGCGDGGGASSVLGSGSGLGSSIHSSAACQRVRGRWGGCDGAGAAGWLRRGGCGGSLSSVLG